MSVATIKYLPSTCSEPGAGLGRGIKKMNRQVFLVVLRGMCVGSDVCPPGSNSGLMLLWVLYSVSLCLAFSICKMGILTVLQPGGCGED